MRRGCGGAGRFWCWKHKLQVRHRIDAQANNESSSLFGKITENYVSNNNESERVTASRHKKLVTKMKSERVTASRHKSTLILVEKKNISSNTS